MRLGLVKGPSMALVPLYLLPKESEDSPHCPTPRFLVQNTPSDSPSFIALLSATPALDQKIKSLHYHS